MHRMVRRILTAAPAAVAVLFWCASPALAECHGSGGDNAGTGTTGVGPTSSSQTMTWHYGNRRAAATAMNSNETATSYCIDATTDWFTSSGHYDARVARNCDATGVTIASGAFNEPSNWGGRDVNGLQKAAGCFYNQTANPYYSGCTYVADSLPSCFITDATAWSHPSHAVWLRRQDGTTDVNNGGFVQLPGS